MKLKFLKKIVAGFLGLSIFLGATHATYAAQNPAAPAKPANTKKIVINSASRILMLWDGDTKVAIYPLGLGKVSTPTPEGYFKIQTKEINPTWIDPSDPEYYIPSGPSNPLGYRWMQIYGNYGIHGTNRPDSIGHYVSNGCIRMREKDVEDLFGRVDVGTPVEINYNRVVVEKADDDNIVYYIYPDGYGRQKLTVDYVSDWLKPFGVSAFESDEDIQKKIAASDGEPTFVGKPYAVEIDGKTVEQTEANGRTFFAKAVVRNNVAYLPAVPISLSLKRKIEWRPAESTLKTSYGTVIGYEMKKQIYCNLDDAIVLFHIDGGLQNVSSNPADGKIFKFRTVDPNQQIKRPEKPGTSEIFGEDDPNEVSAPADNTKPADKKIDEKKLEGKINQDNKA